MFPNPANQTTSSVQIGDEAYYHDSGYLRTNPDGSVWLGSGTLAAASAYPQAAKLEHMQAVGQPRTLPTSIQITDIAGDGAGRWVIASGDATNVYVSTDDGVTWAAVAHNAGGAVYSVCYSSALSLWICAGNSAAVFYVATQTQTSVASAWTVRTGSAITTGTASTACVRASASEVVMVCAGATTGAASRSTNGTAWSAVNLINALSATSPAICRLANNGSNFVAVGSSSSTPNYSTNGGTSWIGSSGTVYGDAAYVGGAFFVYQATTIYRSTDSGATFTTLTTTNTFSFRGVCVDSGKVYCGANMTTGGTKMSSIGVSTDGINFKLKALSYAGTCLTATFPRIAVIGSTVVSAAQESGSATIYQDNFNAPAYVGLPLVSSNTATGSYQNRLYQCIKKG